jgi:hypothetical protein
MVLTANRTPFVIVLLGKVLAVLLLVAFPAVAQLQLGAADSSGGLPSAKPVPPPGPSNTRLFYALPNFLTVEHAGKLPPLTPQQKFKLVARNTFDPVEFPWYGLQAGIGQSHNSEPSYGQGMAGYGRRFALTFADCTVENFMAGAILPSLFHQDPRFYRSGEGTVWRRTGYAASRVFITRGDSGREQFNFSEILGSALAAGIYTYGYHPPQDRTLRNAATGWGTQLAFHTLTIVVKEFWPDLRRKISHTPESAVPSQ